MCYPPWHETADLCASPHGRRARGPGGGLALVRCLHPAPLPDPARQRPRRVGARHRSRPGLRRPDGAQRDPRLQYPGPRGVNARLLPPAHHPRRLRPAPRRAPARAAASQPARLRPPDQPVDAGAGRPRGLRPGLDRAPGDRRDDPGHAPALGRPLAAGQALDHQPRPGVRPKKNARDRLIRWARRHPGWALGFADEVWWSRLAVPTVSSWAAPERRLRLVERAVPPGDPDRKALACYGLWLRARDGAPRDQMWLRFLAGRPVSAVTIQFLAWCVEQAGAQGQTALLVVWDNASWHGSQAVRRWLRAHNRRVKQSGQGVRIVICALPVKSPWLNPIEPKWAHSKRRIVEPARLLTAQELMERVGAALECPIHEPLPIPEKVA